MVVCTNLRWHSMLLIACKSCRGIIPQVVQIVSVSEPPLENDAQPEALRHANPPIISWCNLKFSAYVCGTYIEHEEPI